MIYLIRMLLGLCNHNYIPLKIEDVPYSGLEGGMQVIDKAHRGDIKHRLYHSCCTKCPKVITQKVKL
jgi:hypothetical protein